MLDLGDTILISLAAILLPAILLLIATGIYSYVVITRYSKTIDRLYKMNFNSYEVVRKQIANDLHDQFGSKMVVINKTMSQFEGSVTEEQRPILKKATNQLSLLHHDIRRVLETIHPRDLIDGDWRKSLSKLAKELCVEDYSVEVRFYTDKNPPAELSHNVFRLLQEKLTNIMAHTTVKRVQVDVSDAGNHMEISLVYKNTERIRNWLVQNTTGSVGGRGTMIIRDRIRTLNANNYSEVKNGYVIDVIELPYENTNH